MRGLTLLLINRSDLPVGWDLLNQFNKFVVFASACALKKFAPGIDPTGQINSSQRFAARAPLASGAGAITGGTGAAATGAAFWHRFLCQASSANVACPRTAMYSLR